MVGSHQRAAKTNDFGMQIFSNGLNVMEMEIAMAYRISIDQKDVQKARNEMSYSICTKTQTTAKNLEMDGSLNVFVTDLSI